MRVLDIVTFTLLDHSVAIEDPSTAPGRLWQYGDLQEILDARGILEVCWSRTDEDGATVYLLALWEDAAAREHFNDLHRPTGTTDCYLRYPADLRFMPCADDFSLAALADNTCLLTFCSRPKSDAESARLTTSLEKYETVSFDAHSL